MKKVLSIVLILSMLLSLFSFSASASDLAAAEPTEVTLHTAATQIIISWRNPVWTDANALTAVTLYDGAGSALQSTFDLTSGKIQNYTHTGLTTGNVYNYKLEFTYADGSKVPVKLSTKAAAPSSPNYLGRSQYRLWYNKNVNEDALSVKLDTDELRDGAPTIKLSNHKGASTTKQFFVVDVDGLDTASSYKFSFDVKTSGSYSPILHLYSSSTRLDEEYFAANAEWKSYSYEFTPTTQKLYAYFLIRSAENLWLDNLSLVKVGDETNTDLLASADTAKILAGAKKLSTITENDVTNTADIKSITTAWETSVTNLNSLKFYIKKSSDSTYSYAGEVAGQTAGNFKFENLEPETEYSVKVARVNGGVEVDLKTETVKTNAEISAMPKDVTLHTAATQIIISWRNPVWTADKALTSIALYDGEGNTLNNTFDVTSGKIQNYTHTGLTTDTVYNYELEFNYADGSVIPLKLSSKTAVPASPNFLGKCQYRLWYNKNVNEDALGVKLDKDELRDGAPTIKLLNHKGASTTKQFFTVDVDGLDTESTYKFSFDAKASGSYSPIVSLYSASERLSENYFSAGTNWKSYSYEFTPKAQKFYAYFLIRSAENIWLDNLSLVKVGDETDTNFLAEADPSAILAGAKALSSINSAEVSASEGEKDITVSWDSTVTNFASLKFYIKESGENKYTYAGEAAGRISGNFKFNNLKAETEYSVKVSRVHNGVEVDFYEETISTKVADYTVSAYSLILGETDVEEIKSKGTYTAKVTVKNNNLSRLNAQLIAGIYDNGKLVDAVSSEPAALRRNEEKPLTAEVVITDATYSVKLFVWDNIETMMALSKASKEY